MSLNNKKGPVYEAGLCRCCGATKRCRVLNVEYHWQGQKEIYSEMFLDCFGLVLSYLDNEEQERLICATCVSRLREASSFRHQVLQCEEKLLRASIQLHHEGTDVSNTVKDEASVEDEKQEALIEIRLDNDDDMDHLGYDSGDPTVEDTKPEIKAKKPPKEKRARKTLSTVKRKKKVTDCDVENVEKNQMLQDMENMYDKLKEIQTVESEPPYKKPVERKQLDNSMLSLHNLSVIVENSYVCPFDTSFSDYYCIYCRLKFTDPTKLRDHTATHNPTEFKTVLRNSGSNKKVQIDIYRVDCRLCPESIVDIDSFKQHVRNHGKTIHRVPDDFLKFRLTDSLSCLECGNSFGFFHALKKHMAEHFGTCICDICGAHYFEERMLVLHQKTHRRSDESYTCKECGKSFKSKYTRYIHVARTHTKEAAYQCNKCDEVFFSYMLRYRHMMQAHGEERKYQCEHCDRAYDSRKSLREHNRRLHLKILKHQCDLCDKRFYLPCRLKEHMSSHTGERNYRCECCGKSFPRLRGLKVHMQSHGADKRHKCAVCGAAFTQNVNLRTHLRRQHQDCQ